MSEVVGFLRKRLQTFTALCCAGALLFANLLAGQYSCLTVLIPFCQTNEEEEVAERPATEIAEPRRELEVDSCHRGAGQRSGPRHLCVASINRCQILSAYSDHSFPPSAALTFLANGLGTPLHC